jgi:hypothetical protein
LRRVCGVRVAWEKFMTESGRPEASPKASDLFRWVVLILIAGVVLYTGSFAVGLMTPGWDIFRVAPKATAYVPPSSTLADRPLTDASTSARVAPEPPSTPPQAVELNPPKDAASQDSNSTSGASDVAILPAVNLPQDADLTIQREAIAKEPASKEPASKEPASKDTASRDTASSEGASRDAASPESESMATTSGLAPEARPKILQQDASVNLPKDPAQESNVRPAPLGFAPVSTPRDLPRGAELNARREATAQPSDASPTTPAVTERSHSVKTTQDLSSTPPAVAPKRRAPSEFSRKMWYK